MVPVDLVQVRNDGHIAVITLNGTPPHNALSTQMAAELAAACQQVGDTDARAAILASACPDAFCAGADLKERSAFSDSDYLNQRETFRAAFDGLRRLAVPTIAAVQGYALGGGFELALCCDLIVADETAVFGLPEVTRGIVPGGGGTQLLARRLGYSIASDLLFTGRRIDIEEAEWLRLVNRRVPVGGPAQAALELARLIAANSPVAVRNAKRALKGGLDLGLTESLELEDQAWRTAILSGDRAEGVSAFVQKRAPQWPGR
jgi:enoyl-CoA hydratase/carnithine racemase